MAGGTYTLLIERTSGGEIDVGALGAVPFPTGWYAYTGSALGSGGFARVDRHERVAAGEHDARQWHVDYLLGDQDASIDHVVRSPGVDAECAVATEIGEAVAGESGAVVADFGCSDCGCVSHLASHGDRAALLTAIDRAHRVVRS